MMLFVFYLSQGSYGIKNDKGAIDMLNYETLRVDQQGDVLNVTLSHEKSRNAISTKMMEELIALSNWLRLEKSVHYVIFTNDGPLFSAGANVVELREQLQDKQSWSEEFRRMQVTGQEMIQKLEQIEQITIAALRGSAYGGAVAIALMMDFRIMSENTVMNLPETAIGLFLTWGSTPRLVKAIGALKAKEMIMLGEDYSAEQCVTMNLANEVVAPADMDYTVASIIEKLRKKGQLSIRMTKKLVNAATAPNFGEITIVEPELVERIVLSGETSDKVDGFFSRKNT